MTAQEIKEAIDFEATATAEPEKTQFEKDCAIQFEIIPLSKSHAEYRNRIPDKKWLGIIPGIVNGWQIEYVNKDGKFEYGSVSYQAGMIEQDVALYEAQGGGSWLFEIPRWKGYEPTGRVVFRGYGVQLWDSWERDWYVEEYEPTVEQTYITA